jgi:hypothetical protein
VTRERSLAISLLKQASKAEALGEGAVNLAKGIGRAGLGVLRAGGRVGRGAARAAGVHEAIGTGLGMAGTAAAGLAATGAVAGEAKNRVDNWRLQHGLYPTPPVGYY